MTKPKFDEKELEIIGEIPETPFSEAMHIYNMPACNREIVKASYDGDPYCVPIGCETVLFNPEIFPDNVARGFVFQAEPFNPFEQAGGPDMFGVQWIFQPQVGGSMEDPKQPHLLDDVEDWREKIVFPDIDSWDWEGSAQRNNGTFVKPENFNLWWIQNGFFERMISFMGFEGAALALVDEEAEEDVAELLDAIADLYIDIINHVHKYFPDVNGFYIHDDMGSQKDVFYSPAICEKLIVPPMRKVTDHIHSLGLTAELHACGMNHKQVENIIAAGWDRWEPQPINDVDWLFETYGDRLIFTITPQPEDLPAPDASEEEQRACARKFVEKYCKTDKKPVFFSDINAGRALKYPFREELYVQSRKAYCG